jgi:hypothetical protein
MNAKSSESFDFCFKSTPKSERKAAKSEFGADFELVESGKRVSIVELEEMKSFERRKEAEMTEKH